MTGNGCFFERHEVKFRVTEDVRAAFLQNTGAALCPDVHGESTVCSVYFDTDDYRLMRRSAEHPLYKEKLRLRCYGQPAPDSTVFLEIKKKYDGTVYKRRISLAYADYLRFAGGDLSALPDTQTGREIKFFLRLYPGISPRILVCCERSAFFVRDDDTVRITFDRNIRTRLTDVSPHTGSEGKLLLPEGENIMELKYAVSVPKSVSDALTQCGIRPQSFSKCGTAYRNEVLLTFEEV